MEYMAVKLIVPIVIINIQKRHSMLFKYVLQNKIVPMYACILVVM